MAGLNPILRATITVTDGMFVPGARGATALKKAIRAALNGMADAHQQTLPGHTEVGAATKYGYPTRSPRYVAAQKKHFPGWKPDFRTGELRKSLKAVRGTPIRMISGSNTGTYQIKAVLGGTQRVTDRFRYKKGQVRLTQQQEQLVMRKAEITTVTRDERQVIAQAAGAAFTKFIKAGNRSPIRVK